MRKEFISLSVLLVQKENTLIFGYKQCISSIADETKHTGLEIEQILTLKEHKNELSLNTEKDRTLKMLS